MFEDFVETAREPLLALDSDLRVLAASRSFYDSFKVTRKETIGNLIYDLGNRQWDIPSLRKLLEEILPKDNKFDDYKVEHEFSNIGHKIMLLNARRITEKDKGIQLILLAIEDITERKMAEELQLVSSAYARSLIEASLDPLVTISAQGKITDVNEASVQATGVAREHLIGRDFSDYFTEPDKARAGYQKAFSEGFVRDYPLAIRHASGRIIEVLYNAAVYKDVKGNVLGVFAAARDITERRKIENGLEKTRKELEVTKISEDEAREYAESIINTVREPLLALDSDLRVVKANRSFYDSFKVTPQETIGNLIYALGNRQWDIPKLRTLLEEILPKDNQFDDYEVEHNFATIGKRTMLLNARQIQHASGKERIILLAIEDITERKEIEAGLEKTRKELAVIKQSADEAGEFAESVINTVREPLISLDQDLRVVTVSRSFYEFFKVKPEETVGQLIYNLGNHQWDIPKLRELLETILPEKASFDNYEVEHDFATIGRRVMLLNARQIQQALGKERIILLAIEDVTEKTRLQRELAERTRDAEKAQSEAESATRAKSDFLANMSHELRTPLNSIIGFSEVLEDQLLGALNTSQRENLQYILKAGRHLLSLINDILDLSKVESGKMELEVEQVSLKGMLDASLVMHREKALRHRISLDLQMEPVTDIVIEADERKLKQIMFNLLSNAVKFTPDGGSVWVKARKIAGGQEIETSIEDTGIGIKPEDVPKLFKEFSQLDSVYDKKYEGTGLGLALTKKLVELHGGRMQVASEFGKGSRFAFVIPVTQARKNNA